MAPRVRSCETVKALNVSRDAQSPAVSSSREEDGAVDGQNNDRAGNVLPARTTSSAMLTANTNNDEEDLYGLSPQGRKSLEAAKSSTKPPAPNTDIEDDTSRDHGVSQQDEDTIVVAKMVPKALDGLLSKGASKRDSLRIAEPNISKPDTVAHASRKRRSNDGEGRDAAETHESAPKEQPPSKRAKNNQPAGSLRSTSRKAADNPASSAASSLAALRARKEGRAPQQPQAALSSVRQSSKPAPKSIAQPSKATESSVDNQSVSKQRAKMIQTPARDESKALPALSTNLQSRRLGMFAQTPMQAPPQNDNNKGKQNVTTKQRIEAGNGDGEKAGVKTKGKRALKKTPQPESGHSAYDFPDSSPAQETIRAAKPIKPGALTNKGLKGSGRAQDENVREHQPALKAKAKAKQPPSSTSFLHKEPAKRTNRDIKQKSVALESSAHGSTTADTSATIVNQDRPNLRGQRAGERSARNESIEDFEHAVVDYSSDDEAVQSHAPAIKQEARTVEPLKSKTSQSTGGALTLVKPQAGNSQQEAIVLSDREEPSSPLVSSTPDTDADTGVRPGSPARAIAKVAGLIPRTPAVMRSSPPAPRRSGQPDRQPQLLDATTTRKSAVISFDRTGPRNQGSAAAKRVEQGSGWTDRTSLPPMENPSVSEAGSSRAKLSTHRNKGPPSVAASTRSTRTIRPAPPRNVAPSVEDALACFTKRPGRIAQTPALYSHTKTIPAVTSNVHVDDEGFANVRDYDGPTLVDEGPAPDVQVPMSDAGPTASQLAMPPPAPKAPKLNKSRRAPLIPSAGAPQNNDQTRTIEQLSQRNIQQKRSADAVGSQQPPAKRHKAAVVAPVEAAPANAKDVPKSMPSQPQVVHDVEAHSTASHAQPKAMPTEPVKRPSRKPSRHVSQGSQTVDLLGSPVPKDFVILDNATALESYSQQAGFSSDKALPDLVRRTESGPAGVSAASMASALDNLPPSHQPEKLSSNSKAQPGSPGKDSQAITGIAIGMVDPQKLVLRDAAAPPATDPFVDLEEVAKDESKGSVSSIFDDQLRQHATKIIRVKDPAPTAVEPGHDDPEATLVGHDRQRGPFKRVSSLSTDELSDISASSDETTTTMHNIGTWRNALQPHQVNLFDELVSVSHTLVRSLIDRETATKEAVEDYRRRCTTLVEQMELAHAQEYQKYLHELEKRKDRLRKSLRHCNKELKAAVAAVAAVKEGRLKKADMVHEEEQKLKEAMSRFG